jgi:hypothetical protein
MPRSNDGMRRAKVVVHRPFLAMRCPLLAMHRPYLAMRCPYLAMRCPFLAMRCPFLAMPCPFRAMRCPFLAMHCPFLAMRCPFLATLCPFLAMHCPRPVMHCPLLATHCAFLAMHCPFLVMHCLFLAMHCPLLATHCPFLAMLHAFAATCSECEDARHEESHGHHALHGVLDRFHGRGSECVGSCSERKTTPVRRPCRACGTFSDRRLSTDGFGFVSGDGHLGSPQRRALLVNPIVGDRDRCRLLHHDGTARERGNECGPYGQKTPMYGRMSGSPANTAMASALCDPAPGKCENVCRADYSLHS